MVVDLVCLGSVGGEQVSNLVFYAQSTITVISAVNRDRK